MKERFLQFYTRIVEINAALQDIRDYEMSSFRLNGPEALCLFTLGRSPKGMTAAGISTAARLDKAIVSKSLKELITRGLVVKDAPPEGKRAYRVLLRPSEEGLRRLDEIDTIVERMVCLGGDGFTDEQRRELYSLLDIVSGNLNRYLSEKKQEKQSNEQ